MGKNAISISVEHNVIWTGWAIGVAGAILGIGTGGEFKYPDVKELHWVFLSAFCGMMIQVCLLMSLKYEKASVTAIISNIQVVNVFILDVFVDGNSCEIVNVLGAVCVILGTICVT